MKKRILTLMGLALVLALCLLAGYRQRTDRNGYRYRNRNGNRPRNRNRYRNNY